MRLVGKGSGEDNSVLISLIGPPKAGKTTFVTYLETGKPVLQDANTTLGMELRSKAITIDNWKIKIIDTGGQELFAQAFWEIAVEQSDAVIFVIDATMTTANNAELSELMFEQFDYALDITRENQPLLFLLNKQDLKELNPMSPVDALKKFKAEKISGRTINFIPTSAKYGDGVEEAIRVILRAVT